MEGNMNKDEGFAIFLDIIGYITIILGCAISLTLIRVFSKPGLFGTKGKIEELEIAIIIGVIFYHLMWGTICIGVSKLLRR